MQHILSGYRAMVMAPEDGGASSFSPQADAPLLSAADAAGNEDGMIALEISLNKTDPGESLSLVLTGLPEHTQVFRDAGATASVDVLDGSVLLNETDMSVAAGQLQLWIRPPPHLAGTFSITATATSTETDGTKASVTAPFTLTVDAVAGDVAASGGFAVSTSEDLAVAVTPSFIITDADRSETLGTVTLVSTDADMAGVAWHLNGADLGRATWNAATNRYELTLPAAALAAAGNGAWSVVGLEAVPPANSSHDVDFSLLVETIDGGQSATTLLPGGHITVLSQADAPILSAVPPISVEGDPVPLALGLKAVLGDLDGSETFTSLLLKDVPADWEVCQGGAVLKAEPTTGYVLDATLLDTVTVQAPRDFGSEKATLLHLEAVVRDTDPDTGASTSNTVTLEMPVTIAPVTDVPSLVVRDARGLEDGAIALDIRARQTDADGSEILTLTIDKVPAGAVFLQGGEAVGTYLDGEGWSFNAGVIAALGTSGLTLVLPPADNSNVDVTLQVTLESQDGEASLETITRDLLVDLRGVADVPQGLPTGGFSFTGAEDQAVALDLSALTPSDTDGSERLSVVLSNLPAGFQLTVPAGYEDALIYAGPNRWIVAQSALGVLSLVPPADFSGSRSFTADIIVTENDGAVRVDRRSVSVAMDGVADAATITLNANGTEDVGTPFALSIAVADGASATDPVGETVTSVIIDGLPAWADLAHPTIADLLQPLGNGAYQVNPTYLDNLALLQQLQVLLPEDFGGTVPGIAIHVTTRDSNGDTQVTDLNTAIQVAAVADIAVSHDATGGEIAYTLADVHGTSATGIVLPITAYSSDDDGSETLSYEISGVPEGVLLSQGSNLGGGVWHLTAAQYAQALAAGGLSVSIPNAAAWGLDPTTGFTLSVRAVTREANGALNGDAVSSLNVTWEAGTEAAQLVADSRTIATDFSGNEDAWIPLDLALSGADLDGGDEKVDVVVTGLPAGARLNHGSFDVSTGSWVLSPADLADLAVLPPHNFSGDMSVGVRVVVTEAGGDVRADDFTLTVHLAPVSDAAVVSANAHGLEDQPIALDLSITPGDTTGTPETIIAIRIRNMPAGATLSAGTLNGDGTWTLTPAQLAGLTLTPPPQWSGTRDLQVDVTSQDGTAETKTVPHTISVVVDPVTDDAIITLGEPVSGNEDTAIALNLSLTHADTDGSEVVSVMISGLPEGSALSAGIRDELGNWLLTLGQLAGLTMRPPADWSGTLDLTAIATSLERGTGALSSVSLPVSVLVNPVADKPVADPVNVTTDEDVPVALLLNLAPSDDSESVGAHISGVPEGAIFTRNGQPVGTLVATSGGTNTWLIDAADIAGLTLVPPPNGKGTWTFEVTPVAVDGASTRDGESSPMQVRVNPLSDAPILTVGAAGGNEDIRIPLVIDAALTDASEVLTATISRIPAGASLWWDGTKMTVTNGAVTLNAAQLDRLRLASLQLSNSPLYIQPPLNSDEVINLYVQAFSQDGTTAPACSQEVLLPVTVLPVSDLPNISPNALSGNEDTRIALPTATLADSDGSETLTEVKISGIPDGATLRSGETVITVTNGTAVLPADLRANLTLQTTQDYSGGFSITYSATSQDRNATPATRTRIIPVTVNPVSDLPTIDVDPAEGLEDTRIALTISGATTDIDGSETLSFRIADIPAGSVLRSGETVLAVTDGTATLTPAQLSGLTIQPPANLSGIVTLTVTAYSKDGSAAEAKTTQTVSVQLAPVSDAPTLSPINAEGDEDTAIALNLGAQLTDGSETLSVVISGLPPGASLSAGTKGADGNWTVTGQHLAGLSLIPDHNWSGEATLTIVATSTDHWPNQTAVEGASTQATMQVRVNPVSDAPALAVKDAQTLEDTAVRLDISAAVTDPSESLTHIDIAGLGGASLSAGVSLGNGIWRLTADQLAGLTLTPPANLSGALTLTVIAYSQDGGTTEAATTKTVTVQITPVSDAPSLSVSEAVGTEDRAVALAINPALTDTDGSETLSVIVSNLPPGSRLSAGTLNSDGTWTLTPQQLAGLSLYPGADWSGETWLTVTAVSADHNPDGTAVASASTQATLHVVVNPVSDAPALAATNTQTLEDTAVLLDISAAVTDSSESLTHIDIAGLDGASLSAGVSLGNGIWRLTADQLSDLTLTPPANLSGTLTLTVTAYSQDGSAAEAATSQTMTVEVAPVSDTPLLVVNDVKAPRGTAIPLSIAATLTDPSEVLTVTIADIPAGSVLRSNGAEIPVVGGVALLTPDQLNGLTITPADALHNFNLTVTASSKDGDAPAATLTRTLNVIANSAPVAVDDGVLAGSFALAGNSTRIATNAGSVTKLAVGDYNGDGTVDLMTYSGSAAGIILGQGGSLATKLNGDNFATASSAAVKAVTGAQAMALADLNKDGRTDLVAGSGGGSVTIRYGSSDVTVDQTLSANIGYKTSNVVTADFNGDGRQDIFTSVSLSSAMGNSTSATAPSLAGWLATGSGFNTAPSFTAYNNVAGSGVASNATYSTLLGAVDLNNDGYDDVITTCGVSNDGVVINGKLKITLGNAADTFATDLSNSTGGVLFTDSYTRSTSTRAAAGDITGDGKAEVVEWNVESSNLYVALGRVWTAGTTVDMTNATSRQSVAISVSGAVTSAAIGDLNGDGIADLIIGSTPANSGTGKVWVLWGKLGGWGTGTLDLTQANDALFTTITGAASQGIGSALTVADMNGDGRDDLVIGAKSGTIDAIDGTKFGFNVAKNGSVRIKAAQLLANDSDPDGDSLMIESLRQGAHGTASLDPATGDVVFTPDAGFHGAATFQYRVSDGNGGLSNYATVTLTVGGGNRAPVATDDGLATLPGTVTLAGNSTRIATNAGLVTKLAVGDYNGDGTVDLMTYSGSADGIILGQAGSVATKLNGGNFATAATSAVLATNGTGKMDLTDLNKDGRADLVAGSGGGSVTIRYGSGDVTVDQTLSAKIGYVTFNVLTADFNGDGRQDIFTSVGLSSAKGNSTSATSPSLAGWLATGSGFNTAPSFTAYNNVAGSGVASTATCSSLLGAVDLNNDGYDDVITTCGVSNDGVVINGKLKITLGNAAGTFAANLSNSTGGVLFTDSYSRSTSTRAAAGDITGDGKAEVVEWNVESSNLYVALGRVWTAGTTVDMANATSRQSVAISVSGAVTSAAIGDLNGDGIADLIIGSTPANSGTGKVWVLWGKLGGWGTGTLNLSQTNDALFTTITGTASQGIGSALTVADMNGDGRNDLVIGSNSGTIDAIDGTKFGFNVAKNGSTRITAAQLLANDSDPDGDRLSISAVSAANNCRVALDATGNVAFVAAAGFAGKATFDYTVSDGMGGTDNGTVTVTVSSSGGAVDTSLKVGTTGSDTLVGGTGADTLVGGLGADTYQFARGNQTDTISEADSAAGVVDKLVFGNDIGYDQLWFSRSADDLVISIVGTEDKAVIQNWYGNQSHHVEEFATADGHMLSDSQVENLVIAMAGFVPPSLGQTTLSEQQHTQLDAVIAANWKTS